MMTLRETLLEAGAWCLTSPPGGPSPLDYFLVGVAALIVLYAVNMAIVYTAIPGEMSSDHIKRRILEDDELS